MEEVKVTWRLAWGLWWRMVLISLGVYAVIAIILLIIALIAGVAFLPYLQGL